MTVYHDWDQARSGSFPAMPAMRAIGDSWFWYPVVSNLWAELSAVVKPDYSNILALGRVGATLEQFAKGPTRTISRGRCGHNFIVYYSAVLISGGGNDAVDCRLCLREDCAGLTTAQECIDPETLDGLTDELSGWLLALINEGRVAATAANRSAPRYFRAHLRLRAAEWRAGAFPTV